MGVNILNDNQVHYHLSLIDETELLAEEFKYKYGITPLNLSDWNASDEFLSYVNSKVAFEEIANPSNYIFSYSLDSKTTQTIISKLSNTTETFKGMLFTNASSSSIYNVINWLAKTGCSSLGIICPFYFTVPYGCSNFDINCSYIYLDRDKDKFFLDEKSMQEIWEYKYVWLTNPVYCTSVYYEDGFLNYIEELLQKGTVIIADESLCETGKELLQHFLKYRNFIGIYSPHKSICFNGRKFSVVIFDLEYQDFFDQWADILYGCLSASNMKAMHHFLSPSYDKYYTLLKQKISHTFFYVKNVCDIFGIDYDKKADGYLISLYFKNILHQKGLDINFLEQIMYECETTLITGAQNYFKPDFGFSFRINLCADSLFFRNAFEKTIIYLGKLNSII